MAEKIELGSELEFNVRVCIRYLGGLTFNCLPQKIGWRF